MKITIITGMSGSGKTQVMRYFEDIGYFCVDNMPPLLIPKLLELFAVVNGDKTSFALVVDARAGDMIKELLHQIAMLRENGYECDMLFLDTNDETLVKRYKETRRAHPISSDKGLLDSISRERAFLRELYKEADHVIDTSDLKVGQLHDILKSIYGGSATPDTFKINVIAFGFKYGMPQDADLVFDVRCFPNPFYVEELKRKTGNDKEVQDYVMQSPQAAAFMEKLDDMMAFMIPLYIEEGKTSLTIAVGCTGGKHRSITMANKLAEFLNASGYSAHVYCRDIGKE